MSAASEPPSGQQLELRAGAARAIITSVGGGLRCFEVGGEPIVFGYRVEEVCSGGRGQVLAPWPNRLADGKYEFEGVSGTAALDEPEHHNAIHGLVRWLAWDVLDSSDASVTVGTCLEPQPAYPWRLQLELVYALSELPGGAALTVTARAANRSERRAPFGIGFHPYVDAGDGGVDGCELDLVAERRLRVDGRGLPTGTEPVEGTEYDYAGGRVIGQARLDDCFNGLGGGSAGEAWTVRVSRPDGRVVEVSGSEELRYVMCYTGDTLAPEDRRRGLAIEPMSCPPNALASLDDVIVLEPGADPWQVTWRVVTRR